MIVGQERLINQIKQLSIETLPKNILLIGDKGSGKHLIGDYISEAFHLPIEDITEKISFDLISDIYTLNIPIIYLIDIDQISIDKQNSILKFLEEPPKMAYIILLCRNTSSLLETIINRCVCWYLSKYSKEILKQFLPADCDERYLAICKTPGQLKEMVKLDLTEIINLANTLYTKIEIANFANTLTVADKLAFKNEKDKIDIDIFASIMLYVIEELVENSTDIRYNKAYKITTQYLSDKIIPRIDQKYLFYNFLIKLRWIMRNEI